MKEAKKNPAEESKKVVTTSLESLPENDSNQNAVYNSEKKEESDSVTTTEFVINIEVPHDSDSILNDVNPFETQKGVDKFFRKLLGNSIIGLIGIVLTSIYKFEKYNPDQTSTNLYLLGWILMFTSVMLILNLIVNSIITMWRNDY